MNQIVNYSRTRIELYREYPNIASNPDPSNLSFLNRLSRVIYSWMSFGYTPLTFSNLKGRIDICSYGYGTSSIAKRLSEIHESLVSQAEPLLKEINSTEALQFGRENLKRTCRIALVALVALFILKRVGFINSIVILVGLGKSIILPLFVLFKVSDMVNSLLSRAIPEVPKAAISSEELVKRISDKMLEQCSGDVNAKINTSLLMQAEAFFKASLVIGEEVIHYRGIPNSIEDLRSRHSDILGAFEDSIELSKLPGMPPKLDVQKLLDALSVEEIEFMIDRGISFKDLIEGSEAYKILDIFRRFFLKQLTRPLKEVLEFKKVEKAYMMQVAEFYIKQGIHLASLTYSTYNAFLGVEDISNLPDLNWVKALKDLYISRRPSGYPYSSLAFKNSAVARAEGKLREQRNLLKGVIDSFQSMELFQTAEDQKNLGLYARDLMGWVDRNLKIDTAENLPKFIQKIRREFLATHPDKNPNATMMERHTKLQQIYTILTLLKDISSGRSIKRDEIQKLAKFREYARENKMPVPGLLSVERLLKTDGEFVGWTHVLAEDHCRMNEKWAAKCEYSQNLSKGTPKLEITDFFADSFSDIQSYADASDYFQRRNHKKVQTCPIPEWKA